MICKWKDKRVKTAHSPRSSEPVNVYMYSSYFWRFKGVVCGEANCQEENSSMIWTLGLKQDHTFNSLVKNSNLNVIQVTLHSKQLGDY